MLGLAGSVADGAFTNFLPLSGCRRCVAAHRAGERAGGRPEGSTEFVCRFFVMPGDPEQGVAAGPGDVLRLRQRPGLCRVLPLAGWAEQLDPMVEAYEAGTATRDRAGPGRVDP